MRSATATTVATVLTSVAAFAVVGFWFHTSVPERAVVFGKYEPVYFVALCLWTLLAAGVYPVARAVSSRQVVDLPSGRRLVLRPGPKIAFSLAVVIVLGLAAEAMLFVQHRQAVARRAERARGFHPYLQVAPVPGDESLHVNRWGFRGDDIERDKPPGTFRIFVLGGSTVLSDHVDFEDSHARRLEKALREAYPAVPVEVQNAGTHWYTSQHTVTSFLFRVRRFDPDLVLVYHGVNDLCRSFRPAELAEGDYRSDYGHYHGPVAHMLRTYREGEAGPMVPARLREAFERYWFSDLLAPGGSAPVAVPVSELRSLAAFERNLSDLVRLARSAGVEVMLASQPYLYRPGLSETESAAIVFPSTFCEQDGRRPDLDSMIRGMEAFNAASRRVAREAGVPFVDLESLVPKNLEHFVDDVHYTEKGNAIIAAAFARAVTESGFLEPPRAATVGARAQRGDS